MYKRQAKAPREHIVEDHSEVYGKVLELAGDDLTEAYKITAKLDRKDAVDAVKAKVVEALTPAEGEEGPDGVLLGDLFKKAEASVVRGNIIKTSSRIDGRSLDKVRDIVSEVGVLPRTHGSALFTRGETQAFVVATLGTADDEQFIDSLDGTRKESFLLHYNFPPFSVGETGRTGSPGRREIGHGKLAWRAILSLIHI